MTTNKDYADNINDEHIDWLNNRINMKDKNWEDLFDEY